MITQPQRSRVTGLCHRCGHKCGSGELYGRDCDRVLGAAVRVLLASGNTVAQDAARAIAYGLLTPVPGHPATFVYHRDDKVAGFIAYLVTPERCACLAGKHNQLCHHRAAAIILSA